MDLDADLDMDAAAERHPRARFGASVLLLALLVALLTGCGNGEADGPSGATQPEPGEAGEETGVIVIVDFEYQMPDPVPAGGQITIRNEDGVGHTVTSDEAGLFHVDVAPGEEVMLPVPDEPGEYPFHCTPHPTMTATLVVE
ncbi:cupredoxin domain-containing protein [Pseudactinotalea sp. Z1748]|uniref:cupredoxin domain-containing protein n=1 Tax=Pseudactinotalea sp. Z1748 TaxID=3413027 RepID=UPI003C7AD6BC